MALGWDVNLSDEFLKNTEQEILRIKLKVVIYLLQRIIQRSPVDTGAFRGNHRVSVGAIDESSSKEIKDVSGSNTLSAGISAVSAAKALDAIYVQNNLPYAEKLEYGHSKQAPHGIYALSLNDTKAHFNEIF